MLPKLKVYEIDYNFIIKNYLDRHLWKKFGHYLLLKNMYSL